MTVKKLIGVLLFAGFAALLSVSILSAPPKQSSKLKEVDTAAGKMKLIITPDDAESRARAQKYEASIIYSNVLIENLDWFKGGFDTVMIASFDLRNKNRFDIKDVAIKCSLFAPSGTLMGTINRTVYELIKGNSRKRIKKFNMGFANTQAKSASCEVFGARV